MYMWAVRLSKVSHSSPLGTQSSVGKLNGHLNQFLLVNLVTIPPEDDYAKTYRNHHPSVTLSAALCKNFSRITLFVWGELCLFAH